MYQIPDPTTDEVKVIDPETMKEVPCDGETMGEVMMRGNTVMKGYLNDEKANVKTFEGGYFRTGDLAVRHRHGRLLLKDRSKDIVISGGENISTAEVEAVLFNHPFVAEAAVVAKQHERWGEVPVAVIVMRTDSATSAKVKELVDASSSSSSSTSTTTTTTSSTTSTSVIEAADIINSTVSKHIMSFARSKLAGFKAPKEIIMMTELPKTSTGKIQKFKLREMIHSHPGHGHHGSH